MKKTIFVISLLIFFAFKTGDNKSKYTVPKMAQSVCAVDFDLDKDLDIIIGHKTAYQNTNPTISLMENVDMGLFEIIDTSKLFCGYQNNIFAVDLDGNGYPDMVTQYSDFPSGEAKRYIRVFYNENGNYDNYSDFNLNTSSIIQALNYGDINGDGMEDLIVLGNIDKFIGILYNDGTGSFSDPIYYNTPNYPTDIQCADLNDDGRDDLIIGSYFVEVWLSYSDSLHIFPFNVQGAIVRVADFDQDGDDDVFCINPFYPGEDIITFIENKGNDFFDVLPSFFNKPKFRRFIEVMDYDNDSFPDILTHQYDPFGIVIYRTNGNFDFSESKFIPMEVWEDYIIKSFPADFDNNGYMDIVTIQRAGPSSEPNVSILFNDGEGNFVEGPLSNSPTISKVKENPLFCFPNPATISTKLSFELSKNADIRIGLLDNTGHYIKTFVKIKNLREGEHSYVLNIKGINAGLYFIRLEGKSSTESTVQVVKIIIN